MKCKSTGSNFNVHLWFLFVYQNNYVHIVHTGHFFIACVVFQVFYFFFSYERNMFGEQLSNSSLNTAAFSGLLVPYSSNYQLSKSF